MKQTRNSSPPVIPNIDQPHSMDCVIGMGANLGDRWRALRLAVLGLGDLGTITAISAVYETDPVGGPPQPSYLNAAVGLRTRRGPVELLVALLEIERAAGRERRVRWGPRTLDLDLLWIRDLAVRAPGLEVPHPRLAARAFALVPLLDVAPVALDPWTGVTYREVLRSLPRVRMTEQGRRLAGGVTDG